MNKWERIADGTSDLPGTHRLVVPGGWIYQTSQGPVFVPCPDCKPGEPCSKKPK